MLDHGSFDDSGDGTVFRDVIMLALLGFVTIVVLLLPHLNPPTLAEEEVVAPGNVIVEVRWSDGVDADVDLWVQAPGDRPVGYSNKGGRVFNLSRIPEMDWQIGDLLRRFCYKNQCNALTKTGHVRLTRRVTPESLKCGSISTVA